MLYILARILTPIYGHAHLFCYISVRAILALFTSLLCSIFLGEWFVKTSRAKFRSKVREYTPENHQIKNNTPTMGGLFILLITMISMLAWNNLTSIKVLIFFVNMILFGTLGYSDDRAKIEQSKGIAARTKFILQTLAALLTMTLWYYLESPNTQLCIPFFKHMMPTLGWLFIPWGALVIVSTSNAVNLTDGLDGLATGTLISNISTFAIIAYLAGHHLFASYLAIPYGASGEMTIAACALIGALLGFLWYNSYPAQIFMGDVGSLTLGASLALLALMARQELLIPIAGGIFVLEAVSVIMQVSSFKMFGQRIFRMAPIHHHFELMGWKEPKITVRFWIISLVLSLFALLTLKVR